VAFCSIAYELLLGQSLSAFLGNTVLRYSVTIGLYLLSLGIGAFLAKGKFTKNPVLVLQVIEILLTSIGGFSVIFLFGFDSLGFSDLLFAIFAHLLIIIIGILSGFEIPLLIEISNKEKKDSENMVLGFDYAGTFIGTLVFAFIFYPKIGLISSAFIVGVLNAFAGTILFTQKDKIQNQRRHNQYLVLQIIVMIIIIIFVQNADKINEYLINQYLL